MITVRMDNLIQTIATALDIVEGELLGASTQHGKRIAALSAAMGRYLGMDEDSLFALTSCALLHDNALTEYILAEYQGQVHDATLGLHCEYGQRNAESLQFKADITGFILYHHERADGSGPFHKKEGEIPLGAELIGISDMLDVSRHLQRVPAEGLPELRKDIAEGAGSLYSARAAETLLAVLDEEMLLSLRDNRIIKTANRLIPPLTVDITNGAIMNLAEFITRIIDYKSEFTRRHSTQIAYKAWLMGGCYNYAPDLRAEFYLAAALHDFGKLATPTRILEKPGKLDNDEFRIIADHVRITYELLKGIIGLEELRDWASNHHEKLDGSGYPFGKKAEELDFNSRLMACIDIYQAVSEARPYHPQRNHRDTMEILYPMAQQGLLDPGIIRDMDQVLAPWDGGDLPQPLHNA